MNKINNTNIINALHLLKEMCLSYDVCTDCPAFVGGQCKIKSQDPEQYNITDEVWRAFKNEVILK